jgi:hypothetical protein
MMVAEEMNSETRQYFGEFNGDDDYGDFGRRPRFKFAFIRRLFYFPNYYPLHIPIDF